jgi:hypothetical protein
MIVEIHARTGEPGFTESFSFVTLMSPERLLPWLQTRFPNSGIIMEAMLPRDGEGLEKALDGLQSESKWHQY